MSATSQSFTTSKATLAMRENIISIGEFIGNIFLDLGLIALSLALWTFFWYSLNKLKIWDLKRGENVTIGPDSTIIRVVKSLYRILKNISNLKGNYIIEQCGF
jgi:hypothetical protein